MDKEQPLTNAPAFVIDKHGLSKDFSGIKALKDLDRRVPMNSIFGFLSPNGAGKTITTKLLLGLILPRVGGGNVFDQELLPIGIFLPRDSGLTQAPALMLGEPLPSPWRHYTGRRASASCSWSSECGNSSGQSTMEGSSACTTISARITTAS